MKRNTLKRIIAVALSAAAVSVMTAVSAFAANGTCTTISPAALKNLAACNPAVKSYIDKCANSTELKNKYQEILNKYNIAGKNCNTAGNSCNTAGNNCNAAGNNCNAAGNNCNAAGNNCNAAGKNCPTNNTPTAPAKPTTPTKPTQPTTPTKPTTPTNPTQLTTPTAPNNGSSSVLAIEREVVTLVNQIRTSRGLNALTLDEKLSSVARAKAVDMATNHYFDHNSPTYGSPFDMMKQYGISYRAAGENIAMGYSTAQSVVDGWMNSEGHRANILNSSFTKIGVGYTSNGNYWSQMFIG